MALLTNGLGFGGAERLVEALARDLAALGDEVRVIATTRGGPIGDALAADGHDVSVLGLSGPLDVRAAFALAERLRQSRSEVVHSHLAVSDIASALVAPIAPAWRVATAHNPGVELGGLRRALWAPALRRADRVLAVSSAVAQALPAGLAPIVVRPSLVDPRRAPLDRTAARRRLGLERGARVVLAIARLHPVKGLDVLAAAPIQGPVLVAVIGDGPQRDRLRKAGLRLLGPLPDAAELCAAADVIVCPSRSEGFPQVPLHAMAAGVPVVAARVGGLPEIVVDGKTGYLVPPENPAALAKAVQRLLDAPEEAQAFGEAGRQRLLTEGWTREAFVAATRATYQNPTAP